MAALRPKLRIGATCELRFRIAQTVIFVILALYGCFIRLSFAKRGVPGHLF
jgi:hypothetical protein